MGQPDTTPGQATPAPRDTDMLDDETCWRLLEQADYGRLGLRARHGVDVFPVNFRVHEQAVYLRSAPGSKMIDLTEDPRVAFEIDGSDGEQVWSVVIHGRAKRLDSDPEIERSGVLQLDAWQPGEKFNYVRIVPERITGRRFRPLAR